MNQQNQQNHDISEYEWTDIYSLFVATIFGDC